MEGEVDFFVENTIIDKEDEEFDQETLKRNDILKNMKKQHRNNKLKNIFDPKEMKILIFKTLKAGSYFGEVDMIL